MSSGLAIEHLTVKFGDVEAVKDVSLNVDNGEFFTILGPSGCGKTTTLRSVAGFMKVASGEIFVNGKNITHKPTYNRNLGMVFQNYALFPHMTVYDNVAYGLRVRKMKDDKIRELVGEAMQMVQLTGFEGRHPHQLSGGQQQRVALRGPP